MQTHKVLESPQQPASAPVLRSELDVTVQKMDHVYMLSSVYLEKYDFFFLATLRSEIHCAFCSLPLYVTLF